VFEAVAVAAIQDLFEIVAGPNMVVVIHECRISQESDAGDAQDEILRVTWTRGYTTSGSGGAALNANPLDSGDIADEATVEANNTTQAVNGAPLVLYAETFNVRAGWAYIPTPPTETEYQTVVEVFFLEATYVAKLLWRADLMGAKHILDHFMKQEHLRPMLEWRLEIDHQWSVKPSPYGRRLKKWLSPAIWAELESTYSGAGLEANWEAMFKTIALFRKVAIEVGDRLGYVYPRGLDWRAIAYLQKVKNLHRRAESFV